MYGRIINEHPDSLITPTAVEIGQPGSLTKISLMPKASYEVKSRLKNGKLMASKRPVMANQTYVSEPTIDMVSNHHSARVPQMNRTFGGYTSF